MTNEALRSCSTEVLEHEAVTLAAQIAQVTCRSLLVTAELDRRKAWAQWDGCKSMAHWLAWRCSLSKAAAHEQVRVARVLATLPAIAESFGRGELSYSKVRAITRVATPESDAELLDLARTATAAQLERIIRASVVAMTDPARREEMCELVTGVDGDGFGTVRARIPIEQLPIVDQAIAAALPEESSAEDSLRRRRADALVRICESYLANGDAARPPSERNEAVVHVQVDESGVVAAHDHRGEPVHPESARRILCDCRVQGMLGDVSGPIGVGRRTRSIRRGLRRALQRQSGGRCQWKGCDEHVYVEAHHIRAWVDGGATDLANLVLLCWHHHHLVHEGGFSVKRSGDGVVRCYDSDGGELLDPQPAPTHVPALRPVDDERIVPLWRGEPLDLAAAVDVVLDKVGTG